MGDSAVLNGSKEMINGVQNVYYELENEADADSANTPTNRHNPDLEFNRKSQCNFK